MTRFEEVQMKIAESAKNHLEIFNMQVFIEQFTLDRESRFSLTLPTLDPPFPLSATVSFTYDAFQTGMTLYEENPEEANSDVDTSVELEFSLKLPIMQGYPTVEALLQEIDEEYPDTEPMLTVKEMFPSEDNIKEYEISYLYSIDVDEAMESDLFDQIFEELKEVLELVYRRTKDYIDHSWYRGEE
ncbi:MAG: hypothetical protein IT388_07855 [Nitrospirales bacterium]|nr:hypothetical protein [Nitrospirales bacterium]